MSYSLRESQTALGIAYVFSGPGLYNSSGVHFLQTTNDWAQKCMAEAKHDRHRYEAEYVIGLLSRAYEAGRKDMQKEIKAVLGVAS